MKRSSHPMRLDEGFVLFVDAGSMVSFEQLAAAIARRGVPTVHLTEADNPLARATSRLVYGETHYYTDTDDLRRQLGRLPLHQAIDVQCPEFLLDIVFEACQSLALPTSVHDRMLTRRLWRDKYDASQALDRAGIPAPRSLPGQSVDVAQAAVELGLPMVVKRRTGSGGEGVVVLDRPELPIGHEPDEVLYEQWLPGEGLCYAAVVVEGEPALDCVYRTLEAVPGQGASPTVQVVSDPEVLEAGRAVARLVQVDGPLNLDLVRDVDGTARVVDVNLRAWHSIVALHRAGLRFDLVYLAHLVRAEVPPVAEVGEQVVTVFPSEACDLVDQGRRGEGLRQFVRDARVEWPVVGPRYLLATGLHLLRRMTW